MESVNLFQNILFKNKNIEDSKEQFKNTNFNVTLIESVVIFL
jgi:hypothetical protein